MPPEESPPRHEVLDCPLAVHAWRSAAQNYGRGTYQLCLGRHAGAFVELVLDTRQGAASNQRDARGPTRPNGATDARQHASSSFVANAIAAIQPLIGACTPFVAHLAPLR